MSWLYNSDNKTWKFKKRKSPRFFYLMIIIRIRKKGDAAIQTHEHYWGPADLQVPGEDEIRPVDFYRGITFHWRVGCYLSVSDDRMKTCMSVGSLKPESITSGAQWLCFGISYKFGLMCFIEGFQNPAVFHSSVGNSGVRGQGWTTRWTLQQPVSVKVLRTVTVTWIIYRHEQNWRWYLSFHTWYRIILNPSMWN